MSDGKSALVAELDVVDLFLHRALCTFACTEANRRGIVRVNGLELKSKAS